MEGGDTWREGTRGEGGDTWREGGDTWTSLQRDRMAGLLLLPIRSQRDLGVISARSRLQRDRVAEVADLEDAVARDEHVVGLEVAVQHLRVMIQV